MESLVNQIQGMLESATAMPFLYGFLAMFLTMYGPRLHPRLPPMVRDMFNNNIFRFGVILLVVFLSNNNLQMALIVAIGFLLVTSIATSLDVEEHFVKNMEGYSDFNTITEFYEEEFTNPDESQDDESQDDEIETGAGEKTVVEKKAVEKTAGQRAGEAIDILLGNERFSDNTEQIDNVEEFENCAPY